MYWSGLTLKNGWAKVMWVASNTLLDEKPRTSETLNNLSFTGPIHITIRADVVHRINCSNTSRK